MTVAVAQPPVQRERAATLKPPQALSPGDLPLVARGAADDFPPPPTLSSTPVVRPNTPSARAPGVATGPAWLGGNDPNVRPAAGLGSTGGTVRPLTPPPATLMDDLPVQPKLLDRVKGTFTGEKQPVPKQLPHTAHPQGQPPEPTAATPFRGTGANGAPVYAGPPAYRWYGWGSVTPGANPLAPAGNYPKASANWYSITGATPGAFPVPVSNPTRIAPGTEPPSYGLAARPTIPQPAQPVSSIPPPTMMQSTERPEVPKVSPPAESKLLPSPAVGLGPMPPAPVFAPPPAPVGVPVLTPPPVPKPVVIAPPLVPPALPIPLPDTVAALPPIPSVLPPLPPVLPPLLAVTPAPAVEPVKTPTPVLVTESKPINVVPSPLPTSVTAKPPRDELRWQQSAEPATPAPGSWAPAPGATPLPAMPTEVAPSGHTGSVPVKPTAARGQMPDKSADPLATLIKQVCQGRAEGVEVRYTGTKKMSVCFEIRTAAEAQKLVNDISRRPELTADQIDVCVVVK